LTSSDLIAALEPVLRALEALNVRAYVGGSVASSVHGVPRASIDADIVANLESEHVGPFVERLQGAYYVDETRVRAAVTTRRSFNAIHLPTAFKVDVFAAKRRPFDAEALRRARPELLEDSPDAPRFAVASAEDIVLAKLEWFREGGEVSDRQWADVVGVLKTASTRIDQAYLTRWAAALRVQDLLDRARRECDFSPPSP
jgi:hypothetical protein